MSEPINPKPFLRGLINKSVKVTLKFNKTQYRGQLVSTDNYFNLQLSDAEEFIDDQSKGKVGDIFIRCNNVLWIGEDIKEPSTDGSKKTELIFVDDNSKDGSVEEVEKLQKEGYNVKIIVRTDERGLSSAVLKGFQEAVGEYLICMDADLQHPPESVPQLFDSLRSHPFVLGTRYAPGVGIDKDWPLYRRVISSTARSMARPLTIASDPMSGFFGLQKKYLLKANPQDINKQGFKIALELLAKLPLPEKNPIGEIPFSFGVRTEGESKLSGKVIIQYLQQLKELYIFKFGANNLIMFLAFWTIIMLYLLSKIMSFVF